MSGAGLTVAGLSVAYARHGTPVRAVDGVGFTLARGEALGIVGESGSGKSTLALAIAGLLRPGEARVSADLLAFGDADLRQPSEATRTAVLGRRVGFVFQNPQAALNPVLTIGRQLTDHLAWHLRLGAAEARARAVALLEEVGIGDAERRLHAYPHEFSGGMLQRAMIAIALACDPDWLIADEPTTALDASVQADVVELVAALRRRRGLGLIWITHDLALLSHIADRVAVMYAGRLVEIGPAAEIYARPRHPYSAALLASIRSLWEEDAGPFRTIEGTPPDLTVRRRECAFRPRCARAFARCAEAPPLVPVAPQGHLAACWAAEAGTAPEGDAAR
jgi:peptide/nickel transport system ATP-binding protein/oligopeptide transport system ATP-binding protein